MALPAIVLGDPQGILDLPSAAMKNAASWTLADSDTLAHFIQVHGQIARSRWYSADVTFKTQGGQLLDASFPDLEEFVFAAVYFRQLFAERDQLLGAAVECYRKFVDCEIRSFWVSKERERFDAAVDGPAWPLTAYSVRELFEAFLYGAGLFHNFPKPQSTKRARFLHIYDTEKPHMVMFALHGPCARC